MARPPSDPPAGWDDLSPDERYSLPDLRLPFLGLPELAGVGPMGWHFHGLLPAGPQVCMAYGAPGSAKSKLMELLAFSAALGLPFLGHENRLGPVPVWYWVGEGSLPALAASVAALRFAHPGCDAGLLGANLRFLHGFRDEGAYRVDLSDARTLQPLVQAADLEPGPGLVVFDTQARALAGVDENSNQDMQRVMDNLDGLSRRLGCAVFTVTHTPKGGATPRGASSQMGAADVLVRMEGPFSAPDKTMTVEKVKGWETPPRAHLRLTKVHEGTDRQSVVLVPAAAPEEERPVPYLEECRAAFLAARPVPVPGGVEAGLTVLELCRAVPGLVYAGGAANRAAAKKVIDLLLRAGELETGKNRPSAGGTGQAAKTFFASDRMRATAGWAE